MNNLRILFLAPFLTVSLILQYPSQIWANEPASKKITFADYLEKEITNLENGMEGIQSTPQPVDEDGFFLRQFYLRINAEVGVSALYVLNLNFFPEIEMVWENEATNTTADR